MGEKGIRKGSAVRIFEQRSIGYHKLDVLHEFILNYGHSKIIECLEEMAREAIDQDEATQLSYADQAAYLARKLRMKDYRDASDLKVSLSDEIRLENQKISNISDDLRYSHAKFSFFWYQVKQIAKPRNVVDNYGCQIVSALQVDWGSRDKFSVEHLQAIINQFLDEILRKAAVDPEGYSLHCVWRLIPGKYLEFSKLADQVPELIKENERIAELLREMHDLINNLSNLRSKHMWQTKIVSDYISNWRKTIDAVGLDKIAIQLDK